MLPARYDDDDIYMSVCVCVCVFNRRPTFYARNLAVLKNIGYYLE